MYIHTYLWDDEPCTLLECLQGQLHDPVPDFMCRCAFGGKLEVARVVVVLQWRQHRQQNGADSVLVKAIDAGRLSNAAQELVSLRQSKDVSNNF